MRVSHLAVDDFRSYRHGVVEFPPGCTVLLGRNGQGKTNLVEALAYLSTFGSHRVAADAALVRLPSDPDEAPPDGAVIRAKAILTGGREHVIELEIVRGRANRARLNRNATRPRDILGLVRTVVFAPEDLQLVKGDPSVRRAFMDDVAIQLHPLVAQVRADFDKVARQRAALMKSAQGALRRGHAPELSTLAVWDERFAQLSARLSAARYSAMTRLAEPAGRAHDAVAESGRTLSLSFDASVDRVLGRTDIPFDEVEAQTERMKEALIQCYDDEIQRGVNLVGAHRDDLLLNLGHLPVKGYASHGESWSVALGLRLGAYAMLADDGEEPILILDDVFAELDSGRRQALVDVVTDAEQVIITAAVEDDVPAELSAHILRVAWDAQTGTVVT